MVLAVAQFDARQLHFFEILDFFSDHNKTQLQRDLRRVIDVLADDAGLSAVAILRPIGSRQRRLRLIAIYLTSTLYDHGICTVARELGMARIGGTYAGRAIEERRDVPDFDRWLEGIERRLLERRPSHECPAHV